MMIYQKLLTLLWYLCTPILALCIPQAIYVKKNTLRLPEASGETEFTVGSPQATSYKILGTSD